jgi:predicted metal-dependent RNase
MIFRSLCRHAEIGSNSYLIDAGKTRIVLDAGMHPKQEGLESLPQYDLMKPDSVTSAVITHAHLDHVGSLPVMLSEQSKAKVFFTPAALELSLAMLHNSVNVMQSKRIELGITEYPFFTHRTIDDLEQQFVTRPIERPFDLDPTGEVRGTFYDAGHVLGSVGVMIRTKTHSLFYTGDVNFEDSTLIKGAKFPETGIDTLVIETTRGDSTRRPDYTRESEEQRLCEAIVRVLERRGAVMLPVFAMGKTQEVMTMLHRFKQKGLIPEDTPIYIGGLSTKMTVIYDKYANGQTRRTDDNFHILTDMDIYAGTKKRKGPIPLVQGAIYALSSGMMSENTVSNQFARIGFLENKKNGLFFVGYADPDSPAGKIRQAQHGDPIVMDPKQPPVKLKCEMEVFDFSGHSTREAILDYIVKVKAKRTFLVHGDPRATTWFKNQLSELLPGSEVIVPEPGVDYKLD